MSTLASVLAVKGLAEPMPQDEAASVAQKISSAIGMEVYPSSIAARDGVIFALARDGLEKRLVVLGKDEGPVLQRFTGSARKVVTDGVELFVRICPTDHRNATGLREFLPYTAPRLVGLATSFGFGDRLGLATPGHVRAARGSGVVPIFAQQSIREMSRTQRDAQQVMDDATWGVFQTGWREGFGSDADHLKTFEDVDYTAYAGFTMFTIDPSDHVDNNADTDDISTLKEKFERLPWSDLQATPDDCRRRYLSGKFEVPGIEPLQFSEETLLRAACKYGAAVAHTAKMAAHIEKVKGAGNYELEMSVDETDTPTTPLEHFFVASELNRLGVKVVSLAPRFVGAFEKAVDYRGDLAEFERQFVQHVAIAKFCGRYKLSVHSGSDKFSIYPIAAKHSDGLIHVKTAGTSYLEALRVVARKAPDLFKEILDFAFERFEEDRASYHVSTDLSKVPRSSQIPDDRLESLLDEDNARQLLHITYGSVLTVKDAAGTWRFKDRLLRVLRENEAEYEQCLERHLGRHVRPFARS